jgi:hypothetical protein
MTEIYSKKNDNGNSTGTTKDNCKSRKDKRMSLASNMISKGGFIGAAASLYKKFDWKSISRSVLPKVKILLTFSQIIGGLPTVLDLTFPSVFDDLFDTLKFANSLVPSTSGFGCPSKQQDYISQLIADTTMPMVLTFMLIVAYFIHTLVIDTIANMKKKPRCLFYPRNLA